jgi:hypothetical protein
MKGDLNMKEFRTITTEEQTRVEGGDDSWVQYYVQAMVGLMHLRQAIPMKGGGGAHSNAITVGWTPVRGHEFQGFVAHPH